VTECPYCGQRIRKRAPKLDRQGDDPPRQRRRTRLPRLRAGEIEGIAPETRPVATMALIALSLLATVVIASGEVGLTDVGGILVPLDDAPWRYVTTPFVHDSLAYQFVALVAVGVFGVMIERRFGALATVAVFLLSGAAGAAAAVAVDLQPLFEDVQLGYWVLGANGAALGVLAAWVVDDRRAARRGDDRGNDMIGVAVFAAVLVLLPLAVPEASPVAGVVGAVTGGVLGLLLTTLVRR
jgi:membrane associated rhomboid family serine protease